MKRIAKLSLLTLLMANLGVALAQQKSAAGPPASSLKVITADGVMDHIKVLSSDEFEGRAPGSRGEELSVNYISDQFKKVGLLPGNTDGTYLQKVPVVGIAANSKAELSFSGGGKEQKLKFGDDFVAFTKRVRDKVSVDADMVFVGYGVVAPEYKWDDFKDVDVRGKVIVMLINDPAIPDPKDPKRLDPKMFGGRAMTY